MAAWQAAYASSLEVASRCRVGWIWKGERKYPETPTCSSCQGFRRKVSLESRFTQATSGHSCFDFQWSGYPFLYADPNDPIAPKQYPVGIGPFDMSFQIAAQLSWQSGVASALSYHLLPHRVILEKPGFLEAAKPDSASHPYRTLATLV